MSHRSVSTKTIGRLGNQMFEYAMTRALSLDLGANPVIVQGDEPFELSACFELAPGFRFEEQEQLTLCNRIGRWLYDRLIPWQIEDKQRRYTLEKRYAPLFELFGMFYFNSGYRKPNLSLLRGKDVHCYGYFQSAAYFDHHREEICRDFTFVESIRARCAALAEEMRACESVCMHIRRGDYLTLPEFQVTTPDYFLHGMEYIRRMRPEARFYTFTDDPDYVAQAFADYDVRIVPKDYTGPESMYLGTQCRHHLMSNSSFSWWMQYLAHKPGQIVIAPKRWFNSHYISEGIYQSHWVLMQ